MEKSNHLEKRQGAQHSPDQRFSKYSYEQNEYTDEVEKLPQNIKFIEVFPKTIVNPVPSPDLSFDYSMNPYQGCEHGCSYCYARPTHEFWSLNAGIDFERTILVKKNAPELLKKFFEKKNYQPSPILLSGNTDCYQPCEAHFKLSRALLQTCLDYKHPVSIITKNSLVLRDIDIIKELAKNNLVKVHISLTTLDDDLWRNLEPRTSSPHKRLFAIKKLNENEVPVKVMLAPIIPGLNSKEILKLMEAASKSGAWGYRFNIVRLNHTVLPVFKDWIEKAYPLMADKVMNQIAEAHGGKHSDSRFGIRQSGEGQYVKSIHEMFRVGKQLYFKDAKKINLNTNLFTRKHQQYSLF